MNNCFYLYVCALFIALGGLLSGYDTGVISGALLYINRDFQTDAYMQGLLVSAVSLGAVAGAFINGFFIDKIGRKKTLLITALIFMFGSIFCFFSQNIIQLILSRLIVGCAVGIVSFVAPLYLSEISIKEKRGSIVSFYQIAITLGILASYLVNYFCSNLNNNWRVMFLAGSAPAIILFIATIFQKESPRWLVLKGDIQKSKEILLKFDAKCDANSTVEEIKKTLDKSEKIKFSKKLVLPFAVGIGMMFAQIATGINAIIYYAPTILMSSGFSSDKNALIITVFIGVINFLMTFVAVVFTDRLGRKPLLYIGLSGMMISMMALSLAFSFNFVYLKYISIIFFTVYIISFSMSLGPIGLLLISEVFPLKYRGSAMSFAIVSNFIFNFATTGLFPICVDKLGLSLTFLIFSFICLVCLLFVFFVVPETKGVSLEEIEQRMKNQSKAVFFLK